MGGRTEDGNQQWPAGIDRPRPGANANRSEDHEQTRQRILAQITDLAGQNADNNHLWGDTVNQARAAGVNFDEIAEAAGLTVEDAYLRWRAFMVDTLRSP